MKVGDGEPLPLEFDEPHPQQPESQKNSVVRPTSTLIRLHIGSFTTAPRGPPVIPFGGARNDTTGDYHLEARSQVATLKEKFGKKLRTIRRERRMTQEQFAETLNISVDFLSLVERGRNAPSFETLDRLSKRLKLPVAALFTFDGNHD